MTNTNPIIGKWALIPDTDTLENDGTWHIDRQGRIIAAIDNTHILIELHSQIDGSPTYCIAWPTSDLHQLHICMTETSYHNEAEKAHQRNRWTQ